MASQQNVPIVTGYYRWTDIKFEWSSVLPDNGDGNPLSAVLAYEALVHPQHPLHVEGVEGVQLYQGTFPNGESRLMFSSKQIDYLRYWLHAMKLTKDMIPMPYSTVLLTESNLRHVVPVVYKNAEALKQGFKQMDKINKRLKGTQPLLKSRRFQFELIRSFFSSCENATWCAMDFEAWEYDHTVITEFGFSLFKIKGGKSDEERGHWTVQENERYENGQYVPENRNRYAFGESQKLSKKKLSQEIASLITRGTEGGPLFLIFHDNSQDMKYLRSSSINAPLDGYTYTLPDAPPDDGIYILDTSEIFAALEGEGTDNKKSLEKMCRLLNIETEYLHNAGNDAHYTLLALASMASGDKIDDQRKERWPERATEKMKVKWEPWDDNPEYSDEEGVLGPLPPGANLDSLAEGENEK